MNWVFYVVDLRYSLGIKIMVGEYHRNTCVLIYIYKNTYAYIYIYIYICIYIYLHIYNVYTACGNISIYPHVFFHPNCTPKYPMIFPGVVDQTPPVELAFLEATEPPNSPIFTEVSDHSDIPAPGPTCCGLCDELRGERVGCRHGNMWKLGLYMVIICYYTVTPLVSLDLGKNMKK